MQNNDELELYKQVNGELRRLYDYIVKSFEHVRNKALALLVGEVAIVTFLFSGNGFSGVLKHAQPPYGIIVYALGIALLVYAFAMFLAVIATIVWRFPTEEYDMKNPTAKFNDSPLEFQKYLHAEYMSKIPSCIGQVAQRSGRFMQGTYTLSVGIALIILVRYGGGV